MEKSDVIMIDELNPYVRKVGIQGKTEWKNSCRRIYDYEWMYCVKGNAWCKIGDKEYKLERGSLLLIKPNTPHNFWLDKKNLPKIIWVHFDFKYRKDVYKLENLVKKNYKIYFEEELPKKSYLRKEYKIEDRFFLPEIISMKNVNYVEQKFEEMLSEFRKHTVTWQLTAKASILLILEEVIKQINYEDNKKLKYNNEKLEEHIKEYIHKYYFRKITRKDIAKYLGYNEDYIGKVFKSRYGCSISTYVNNLRIEKAKEFLEKTDLSITEISELVGFNEVYYFSKKMKKITGYSPTEWKKMRKLNKLVK